MKPPQTKDDKIQESIARFNRSITRRGFVNKVAKGVAVLVAGVFLGPISFDVKKAFAHHGCYFPRGVRCEGTSSSGYYASDRCPDNYQTCEATSHTCKPCIYQLGYWYSTHEGRRTKCRDCVKGYNCLTTCGCWTYA